MFCFFNSFLYGTSGSSNSTNTLDPKSYLFSLNYGTGYSSNRMFSQKFALGFTVKRSFSYIIVNPVNNLLWYDYNSSSHLLGYSRNIRFKSNRNLLSYTRKRHFLINRLSYLFILETGVGLKLSNTENTQENLQPLIRLSPKLHFRIKKRMIINPYYTFDFLISDTDIRHEWGLKVGLQFEKRKRNLLLESIEN